MLPFLERSESRHRFFKRIILAATAALIAGIVALAPAARYRVQTWTDWVRDEMQRRVLGLPVSRERIQAEWSDRRRHQLEQTRQNLSRFYRDTTDEMRGLFHAAGMDPEHALVAHARADEVFVFSSRVFERDDRGRSYRLRPNTRSVWLRHLFVRGGPFSLPQVVETPELRAAAAAVGAIVHEPSVQHTNSWGLHGPEPDLSAPIRAIVLGDSIMQAMYIGDDDTPPIQLERYLESAWKKPVTILNTGHVGYSPEQYYYTLLEYGDRVRPWFVVVSVCPNDFGENTDVFAGRGEGFDEAGYWLDQIRQWCQSKQVLCMLVPAPVHSNFISVRRCDGYPGTIDRIYRTVAGLECDPLNDFADEHLRLRRLAERAGQPIPECPLYNYEIADYHFSPRGAELWAKVVGRRLTLLLDPNEPASARSIPGGVSEPVRTAVGSHPAAPRTR